MVVSYFNKLWSKLPRWHPNSWLFPQHGHGVFLYFCCLPRPRISYMFGWMQGCSHGIHVVCQSKWFVKLQFVWHVTYPLSFFLKTLYRSPSPNLPGKTLRLKRAWSVFSRKAPQFWCSNLAESPWRSQESEGPLAMSVQSYRHSFLKLSQLDLQIFNLRFLRKANMLVFEPCCSWLWTSKGVLGSRSRPLSCNAVLKREYRETLWCTTSPALAKPFDGHHPFPIAVSLSSPSAAGAGGAGSGWQLWRPESKTINPSDLEWMANFRTEINKSTEIASFGLLVAVNCITFFARSPCVNISAICLTGPSWFCSSVCITRPFLSITQCWGRIQIEDEA